MPRTLSEAEFEQVKADVLASAPPNMDEATFHRWAGPQLTAAIAEAELRPAGSATSRLASNFGAQVNPVTMAKGLWKSIENQDAVTKTLENIIGASAAQAGKAKEAYQQGRYGEMLRRGLAVTPVIGPAAAAAGEQIESGDVAGGIGTMLGLMTSAAAPNLAKAAAPTRAVRAVTTPIGEYIGSKAVPLVRAGVKAPLGLLKQEAGASTAGVNFGANRLAKFLIDNQITTPGQATQIIKNTEAQLQTILAAKGHVLTDAPSRAQLYLDILEKQAAKSVTPDHAATIRAAAADLIEGPLGETVTTTVMRPVITPGRGVTGMAPVQQTSRALRADVPAAEALDIGRTTSRFETRRSWGEQKGTGMEAVKAEERAVRDAFKVALPETRTVLERQGQAILAEKVMDRAVWRAANRDQLSLPGLVGLSANAVVGFAAHWLRNNQVRAGIWADQLAKAITTNNAAATAGILSRLGVRLPQLGALLEQLQRAPAAGAVPAGVQGETP